MTHQEKVNQYVEDMKRRGLSASTSAPPMFRLLWKIGLEVPPPLFLGFFPLTLLMGVPFGVLWGLIMWLIQWQFWSAPVVLAVLVSLGAGAFFGLAMAGVFKWQAAKHKLPRWEDYRPEQPTTLAPARGPQPSGDLP